MSKSLPVYTFEFETVDGGSLFVSPQFSEALFVDRFGYKAYIFNDGICSVPCWERNLREAKFQFSQFKKRAICEGTPLEGFEKSVLAAGFYIQEAPHDIVSFYVSPRAGYHYAEIEGGCVYCYKLTDYGVISVIGDSIKDAAESMNTKMQNLFTLPEFARKAYTALNENHLFDVVNSTVITKVA